MIETLLIANRGEIARRIQRTCHEMGIRTIAVFSDADRDAPHVREADLAVRLGRAPAAESYLDIPKLLAIALGNGADAIHPGYGFLAENPAFSEACADQGVRFVGPSAAVIAAMGDKAEAKRRMEAAGVPVVPGYQGEAQDDATLRAAAGHIGYPVLLKAVAGGGGRGIRLVERAEDFAAALESARREAESAFGDGRMLVEKYLASPRHVEFQVLADSHGTVLHLYERECSVQRRHQKLVEETPSPALTPALREAMADAAVRAAGAIGYVGAGTVEFLVDAEADGDAAFYFMEMNTRLQVEHPVTELTLGLDLVRLQIEVAEGRPLALRQEELAPRGHAIECRLNAEDPAAGFLPAAGPLHLLSFPAGPGLRVDTGYETGSAVSPHYDSLLAKLIAHGSDRAEALRRMRRMLAGTQVAGIPTNLPFLQAVLAHPDFAAGSYTTRIVEQHEAELMPRAPEPRAFLEHVLAAAALEAWRESGRHSIGTLAAPNGVRLAAAHPGTPIVQNPREAGTDGIPARLKRQFRLHGRTIVLQVRVHPGDPDGVALAVEWDGGIHRARYCGEPGDGQRGRGMLDLDEVRLPLVWQAVGNRRWFTLRGTHVAYTAEDPALIPPDSAAEEAAERLKAPLPGRIIKLAVAEDDRVVAEQVLLVLEAMKVEHAVTAPFAGTVKALHFAEGDLVNRGDRLLELEPADEGEAAS